MMIEKIGSAPLAGDLIYRTADRAFDVNPRPDDGGVSLLVNDVQIELDEDGTLLFVWGFCPHESWLTAPLPVPLGKSVALRWSGSPLVPGVSRRLNPNARWPVTHDPTTGWICVGNPAAEGERLAFAPGSILVLHEGMLTVLWLHPRQEQGNRT
jgi:hypothetical protein